MRGKYKQMTETDQKQLLKDITSFLENRHIPYMITGAWSVIYYGRPRASHDIDFVVEIDKREIPKIKEAFQKLSHAYIVDLSLIEDAILHKAMFNLLYLPTGLKLDFWILKDDVFDKTRFARRKKVKLLGQIMSIATQEDTILKKLLWYKESKIEKHFIDAAFVYQIQKAHLDEKYLKKWAKKQKTTRLLKELAKINLEKYY